MNEFVEFVKIIIGVLIPIFGYILAGYYASNAQWCSRKITVAVIVGLCIGAYGIYRGIAVDNTWVDVAFNSAEVMGAIYLVDRVVKGFAKRAGINWLYTDDPIGDEKTE